MDTHLKYVFCIQKLAHFCILEHQKVALENAMFKDQAGRSRMLGTIKASFANIITPLLIPRFRFRILPTKNAYFCASRTTAGKLLPITRQPINLRRLDILIYLSLTWSCQNRKNRSEISRDNRLNNPSFHCYLNKTTRTKHKSKLNLYHFGQI